MRRSNGIPKCFCSKLSKVQLHSREIPKNSKITKTPQKMYFFVGLAYIPRQLIRILFMFRLDSL
jgi:hypothetical protein